MSIINNKIKYLFIYVCFFIVFFFNVSFGYDLKSSFHFGINNIAKINRLIPITVTIENRDSDIFVGKLLVNHYENNDSIYQYEFDIELDNANNIRKTIDIYLTNNINTFYVQVVDNKGETFLNERYNIDLSQSDNKLITGIITNNENLINVLNDIYIKDYTLSTKTVRITEDDFNENREVLNLIDLLVISDIDENTISPGLNNSINEYYLNGNPILLATGEKGDSAIPNCFKGLISRPSYNQNILINFNDYIPNLENSISESKNINIYNYDFLNNSTIYSYDNINLISMIRNNNLNLMNTAFSLSSIIDIKNSNMIFTSLVEEALSGNNLINYSPNTLINSNNYYSLKNLVDEIDNLKLPNTLYVAILLISYLLILTIVLYGVLRNLKKIRYYGYFSVLISILFIFFMYLSSNTTRRDNTFMTYISLIDVNKNSSKETSILNFKTSDNTHYSFSTNSNNMIYPVSKINNEPILSLDFINENNLKLTNIYQNKNNIDVGINNAINFDSNVFMYENKNYISDKYDINYDVKLFDGKITGRITNNMDFDINDVSIYSFGKVIYIGNIKSKSSVPINTNRMFNAPVGNNSMCSELMCYYPNTKIVEYYLNNNIKQYYDNSYLFCFIDESLTMDINSKDVKDKFGKTLIIIKQEIKNNQENLVDLCTYSNKINTLRGDYNISNNSITGEYEVVNEYEIDNDINVKKIYLENLSNYDIGKLNYNVPFYGDIYIYNFVANRYEIIDNNTINSDFNEFINNNKMRLSFIPTGRDILYRNISLPIIRYIGEKR